MADGTAQPTPAKRAAHRSPNYPAFGLTSALEKVRKVYDKDRRTPTTPHVIAGHLGYKQIEGPGGRAVSCLRQYGLLEESAGMLKVSDLAFKLLHLPAEDPEKADLMRLAALKPNLYRQLHEDYPGGIPSDSTLTSNLLKREFNPRSTAALIADFRDTMAVAKVYDVSDNGAEDESKMENSTPGNRQQGEIQKPMPPGVLSYAYPLAVDVRAELILRGPINADQLEMLRDHIDLTIRALGGERRKPQKGTTA